MAQFVTQIRDFTSLFQKSERKAVIEALSARGTDDVRHEFTDDGGADFFLFTLKGHRVRMAIGKGQGEFFVALARSGTILESSRDLTEILTKLQGPDQEDGAD